MMSGLDVRYPGLGPRMIDLDLTTQDGPTRVIAWTGTDEQPLETALARWFG
jgi:hypothetical protein